MVLKNYFDALPNELMESARIDGGEKGDIHKHYDADSGSGTGLCADSDLPFRPNELQMAMIF